jgi:hypothetical protein
MSLDTSAGTILWAAPDWEDVHQWVSLLGAYVNLVEPDADVCLVLDASGDGPPTDVVVELVSQACMGLTDGRPFAEILLLDAPEPRPDRALTITSAGTLLAALGLPAPVAPEGHEEVVAHAIWAKQVLDAVHARLDRWRYDSAPEPPAHGEPLVTVRIAIWGDVTPLLTVALPSVLNGSWPNVEVLVCSDGPQPHARAAVEAHPDPRVRYLELPERPTYPDHPHAFWQSAGTHAVNHALGQARGSYIAPLDHDDAFTLHHIRTLVDCARRTGADFVYGQAMAEHRTGYWHLIGSEPLAHGQIAHGSVLYSSRLAHMRLDPDAWVLDEPGDWNMWRRTAATGAQIRHVPTPVVVHFKERTMIEADPRLQEHQLTDAVAIAAREQAADVRSTQAHALLEIPGRARERTPA